MQTDKRILFCIMLLCLFLTGCHVETDKQQVGTTENTGATETGAIEKIADSMKEAVTNMITICKTAFVTGKSQAYESERETDLQSSIQDQIMSGNYRNLECEEGYYWDSIQAVIERGDAEWRQIDLNGDGTDDLILQDRKTISTMGCKRMIGVIACEEDQAKCIASDLNDGTEFSFCGPTGELMYSSSSYGGDISSEYYRHYHYDKDWNEVTDYELVVYRIDMETLGEPEYAEKWKTEHPDMASDGIYYRKYTETETEALTLEELKTIYETETGYQFYTEFSTEE